MRNKNVIKEVISSSPEVSSTAQLAQVGTETLYGVKRRMNLRLHLGLKLIKTTVFNNMKHNP